MRLDQRLFELGLAESRERARALVMAGQVYVNGQKAEKAGLGVEAGDGFEVRGEPLAYVSRGGLKLEKALRVFGASPQGLVCMDVGASTGGFTDCMLQNGAARVYAVDVGYGQLAWRLRCDERVVVLERTNIRHIEPAQVPEPIAFFTVDVSFISLSHVFPVMHALAGDACAAVCLVKPQFEAGREKVGKNGVVRDAATHTQVLYAACAMAAENGFSVEGLDYSPITGPKGNREFMLYAKKSDAPAGVEPGLPEAVVEKAHAAL